MILINYDTTRTKVTETLGLRRLYFFLNKLNYTLKCANSILVTVVQCTYLMENFEIPDFDKGIMIFRNVSSVNVCCSNVRGCPQKLILRAIPLKCSIGE